MGIVLFGVLSVGFTSGALPLSLSEDDPRADRLMLVFSDEFDGSVSDAKKWSLSFWGTCSNRGNAERQCNTPAAVQHCRWHAPYYGRPASCRGNDLFPAAVLYSSGVITSFPAFSQQYGYFEARIRVPAGRGLWPAFWLLPADNMRPPEVDVMEVLGHEPTVVYMTSYHEAAGVEIKSSQVFAGPDFSKEFYTFGLSWRPTELVWYIDGIERYRTREHVPQEAMYILLNMAVGGNWAIPI
jgi:beta-glucanase (GH16 family)